MDLGETPADRDIAVAYSIKNAGLGQLKISKIQTSCGQCTAVLPSSNILNPGQTGVINVHVNITKKSGDQSFFITVCTNDPVRPKVILELKFKLSPFVTWSPDLVDIGKIKKGKAVSGSISLKIFDFVKISNVGCDKSRFSVKMGPLEDDQAVSQSAILLGARLPKRRKVKLSYAVVSDPPVGPFFSNFDLYTNDPKSPVIVIPIRGEVLDSIKVEPAEVFFNAKRSKGKCLHTVKITSNEVLKIRKIDTNVPGLLVTSQSISGGYLVNLTLSPQKEINLIDGYVKLETTSPEKPVIELGIQGIIKD